MFVFFGRKTSVKPIRGGRQVIADCPSCGETAKFHECEQEKTLHLYVVLDLFSDKQTVYRCTNCGDVFELSEEAASPQASARATAGSSAATDDARARAEREQDERRAAREARARAEREEKKRQSESTIEEELAALKRKLHRD